MTNMTTRTLRQGGLGLLCLVLSKAALAQTEPQPQVLLDIFVSDTATLADQDRYPGVRNLATANRLLGTLNRELPGDMEAAQAIVRVRLTETLTRDIETAIEDLMVARSYRVTRLPALVIDRRYLIEGPASVADGLQIYRQWRAQHGQ